MEKKILAIIGAGEGAIPIFSKAKEMGVKTLAFARNDSVAKDMVDIFIEENSFDIDFMVSKCREYNVNGIMPSSELSTEVAAKVAHELGLPGNDVEQGFAGKNKYIMRTRVAHLQSVKQPKFSLYDERETYTSFPVVVKSVDSCGKRGISIANNKTDFDKAIHESQQISSDGTALIEEYLEGGQEYSIECLSNGKGQHYVIQYTEKESAGPPHFVELAHHQPANLSDEMKHKIDKATWDILEVLGLNCGMAHLEIKIIDNDIYFIEVGARGGGGHISDILTPLSTGFDYYRAAIECSIGMYNHKQITSKLYTGLYYHCKQNAHYKLLFDSAKSASWCVQNTVVNADFGNASCNVEAMKSGYIIYCSDHKIGLKDCKNMFHAQLLNHHPNAKVLIQKHCQDINNDLGKEKFEEWFKKIVNTGNVIAIIDRDRIIAFALLYCNHKDTLDAYLCNVYVLEPYRGIGLSVLLLEKAVDVCKENGFKSISLHVDKDNYKAIHVYEKYGFKKCNDETIGDSRLSMRLLIK